MNSPINIVSLIEKDANTRLSSSYQNELLNKIKNTFSDNHQQLFVSSFYCYLNYHSKTDFVVDFTHVWKWCGFTRKDPAKRLLCNLFVEKVDYIVEKAAPEVGAAFSESKLAPPLSGASFKPEHGGQNKERILLNISTFKKFCLKAETKKADEIHDYYIKLEELLQETLKEQTDELQNQLQKKQLQLQQNQELLEQKEKVVEEQKQEIDQQTKKLKHFVRSYKTKTDFTVGNCYYLVTNSFINGMFKAGKSTDINKRIIGLSTSAPVKFELYKNFYISSMFDLDKFEKYVFEMFKTRRPDKSSEWFSNDCMEEMASFVEELANLTNKYCRLQILKENLEEYDKHEFHQESSVEKQEEVLDEKQEEVLDEKQEVLDEKEEVLDEKQEVFDDEKEEVFDEKEEKPIILFNPRDFAKFIRDSCEVGKDYFDTKVEIRSAYRIWSKNCTDMEVKNELAQYLKDNNFISGKEYYADKQAMREVYRGLRVKSRELTMSENSKDYERFVFEKCKFNPDYRIGFGPFFEFFENWKRETEPGYKITHHYKKEVRKYLTDNFLEGKVYLSAKYGKPVYSAGVFGLGIEEDNFGKKEEKSKQIPVGEYDVETNTLLRTFNSNIVACKDLNISYASLTEHLKYKKTKIKQIPNRYYRYIQ